MPLGTFRLNSLAKRFAALVVSGWDILTANISNIIVSPKNFSVGGNEGTPTGVFFKEDGTKMFTIGSSTDAVQQYTLSTAWDVTTAVRDGQFAVGTQDGTPQGLFFKPDGTRMFTIGASNDRVYQYDLSTAWVVTTGATNSGVFFSIGSQDLNPTALFFKPDGLKMFILGTGNDRVNQYNLSTAWDLSTASLATGNFLVSEDALPTGLFFKDDGTRMFVVGDLSNAAFEYSLSTAWEVTSALYTGRVLSLAADNTPTDIFFKPDGTTAFTVGSGTDRVREYTLVVPWSFEQAAFFIAQDTQPQAFFFKPDGTKMYVVTINFDTVYQYALNTPWDLKTATYENKSFSVAAADGIPTGLFFKPDGTKMYVVGQLNDRVSEFNLSTAWDISTSSFLQETSIQSQDGSPSDIYFRSDGAKMYMCGQQGDSVYQYSLSTPWNISTLTSDNISFSIAAQEGNPQALFFKDNGTRMFVLGSGTDIVYQYNLSTAWNVSTAVLDTPTFNTSTQLGEGLPTGLHFKPDGTEMYILGSSLRSAFQVSL